MPLAFLAPLALGALALVAAPVVVHMLRRSRSRRLAFPSLRFLRESPSLVRRLSPPNRRWLLALRIAVIAALAIAAARPVWTGDAATGSVTVVLLDASASMRRPAATEAARAAARDVLAAIAPAGTAAVATYDTRLTWLTMPGPVDRAGVALNGYAPGYATARHAQCLAEAARAIADAPVAERRIVVVSDFQRTNGAWDPSAIDGSVTVETRRIENEYGNAFVAGAEVAADRDGERVAYALVEAGANARRVARGSILLADGAAADGVVVATSAGAWSVAATLPDGFDADDVRYVVPGDSGRVAVCDPGSAQAYLNAAARVAFGDAAVFVAPRIDGATLAGASLTVVTTRALDAEGASAALEAWLRGGGTALVFAAAPIAAGGVLPDVAADDRRIEGATLSEPPGAPATNALRASPILARRVSPSDGDEVVVRDGAGQPVAVRRPVGAGTVTVAGFDPVPDAGRLVLDGAFPDILAALARRRPPGSVEAGTELAGIGSVTLGGRRVEAGPDGTVRLEEPGIAVVDGDGARRLLAVNVPVVECEPGQMGDAEVAALDRAADPAAATVAARRGASERRWPLWRLLLAAGLVAVFAELAVSAGRRRRAAESPDAGEPVDAVSSSP